MKCRNLALISLAAGSLLAQGTESDRPLTLGFKVGVPITDMFSANNTSEFNDGLPEVGYTRWAMSLSKPPACEPS
jgi:hypothetical protein